MRHHGNRRTSEFRQPGGGWRWSLLAALLGGLAALLGGPADAAAPPAVPGATYVGSEICRGCHEDQFKKLDATLHGRVLGERGRTLLQQQVCESCHGPGSKHLEDQADPKNSVRFGEKSGHAVAERNGVCLQCHERGKRMLWVGSAHESRDVSCTSCHSVKSPRSPKGQLKAVNQLALCRECHAASVAVQMNWSHMPVREGKLQCSSCHNVHGTVTEKLIPENSVNENCYRCHMDKRGPFLWEHGPVRESCLNCHRAHGGNNIRLLKMREPRLCQQCHNENRHPSTAFSVGVQDRRVLGRSCAVCHNNIHGSNHPSGFAFTR
jgi:DmsE family decaheme c-type cytochrome